jgi:hypothetical protein
MNTEIEEIRPRQMFMKTSELSKKLNLSIRTIERLRNDKIIPYMKISKRIILHDYDKVLDALKNKSKNYNEIEENK